MSGQTFNFERIRAETEQFTVFSNKRVSIAAP